jgi:hypothetical protein
MHRRLIQVTTSHLKKRFRVHPPEAEARNFFEIAFNPDGYRKRPGSVIYQTIGIKYQQRIQIG